MEKMGGGLISKRKSCILEKIVIIATCLYFYPSSMKQYFSFITDAAEYSIQKFRSDSISGLTVALVALPQTMAYALIAGVPPMYGIYAAIVPVIIASLFGSSKHSIAGPTNAVAMLVFSALVGVQMASAPDEVKMPIVFLLALMVGVIQIGLGVAQLGALVNFVSHSIIIGFTAGAGILIAFNQIKNLIGVKIPASDSFIETMHATLANIGGTNPYALGVGILTIIIVLSLKRFLPKVPGPLTAIVLASGAVVVFGLESHGVKTVGSIPQSLPPFSLSSLMGALSIDNIKTFISSAFAIAFLGVIEAIAIAKSIATESKQKIDSNQEFVAQGMGNVAASLFSGIPGTGSFTRSAVNFKSGAMTRFSGIFSALFIATIVLLLAPFAKYIPQPALAAILMLVAYSMVNKDLFIFAYRATKSDRVVLLITLVSTLVFNLEMAIYIGIVLSIILFLRKAAMPEMEELVPNVPGGKLVSVEKSGKEPCKALSIIQIKGEMFFGSISTLDTTIDRLLRPEIKVVILRMRMVQFIDAAGAEIIEKLHEIQHAKGGALIISGANEYAQKVLKNVRIYDVIGAENFVENTEQAIHLAFSKYIDAKECPKGIFTECLKM